MKKNIKLYSTNNNQAINKIIKIENWQSQFTSCIYSDRLLNKLLLINKQYSGKIDLITIKKAIYYAKKYHGTQKRLTGEPYYSHPIEVAYQISDYICTTEILVTSILHDTIEDTELTKKIIKNIFGSNIANNVEDLTRIKFDRKISAATIVDLLQLQNKNDLLLIKYFDRLHNMQSISVKLPIKIFKTIDETLNKFINLGVYLETFFPGLLKINETLMNLCSKQLSALSQANYY